LVVEGIGGAWAAVLGDAVCGAQDIELDGPRFGGVGGEQGLKQAFEDIAAIAQAPFLFEIIDLG
jgi:hypothetical protein